jgi:methylamine--corrinoid protein Co-methyltransferase
MDKNKVDYDYFLSVLDKADNGPLLDEKDWDRQYISMKIKELVKKYDISWDKAIISVPYDDSLADRAFEAGMELAIESGVYCTDTHRQMLWARDELENVLFCTPSSVMFGTGDDSLVVQKRSPDQNGPVAIIGGPIGILCSEALFLPMMISYAKEPLFNRLATASLLTTHGRTIRAKSPWDVVACWQEVKWTFEAIEHVGRPGLAIGGPNSSASAIGVLTTSSYGGFRPTDWRANSFISELKVSYEDLIRATHFLHSGCNSYCFYNPIYGGYAGGAEGIVIAMVAGMLLQRACLYSDIVSVGPSHAHMSCNTYPDMVSAQALAFQAMNRNTIVPNASFVRPLAGPGVADLFYEVAAITMASVSSGVAVVKGVQTATGRFPEHCSPLECRFMAQVAHATEKLSRKEADPIVMTLIGKYKEGQKEMKIDKSFHDVYDLDKLDPTPEWMGIYAKVCQEMAELGVPL